MFLLSEFRAIGMKYNIKMNEPMLWDRQTVLILCQSQDVKCNIMELLRSNRKPQSHHNGRGYEIDGFVNLNYNINERDPANRNVRIVYCDMSIMTLNEIYDRFPNSYIIKVEGGERNNDESSRISREVPQISG